MRRSAQSTTDSSCSLPRASCRRRCGGRWPRRRAASCRPLLRVLLLQEQQQVALVGGDGIAVGGCHDLAREGEEAIQRRRSGQLLGDGIVVRRHVRPDDDRRKRWDPCNLCGRAEERLLSRESARRRAADIMSRQVDWLAAHPSAHDPHARMQLLRTIGPAGHLQTHLYRSTARLSHS